MRWLGYVLSVLAVMGLAIWAYGQNHRTQTAMTEVRELRREIRRLNESLDVQRAEWAYLNRPERLRLLVDMAFEDLALLPMTADSFGRIDEIPFPPLPAPAEDRP